MYRTVCTLVYTLVCTIQTGPGNNNTLYDVVVALLIHYL
jgi:hypothetical protein